LLPGELTPRMEEDLCHLATWVPFERAAQLLRRMQGVVVSAATVRRHTEASGAGYVAVQEAEVERIEREGEPAPVGPAKQLLSVDGTMVSLVKREWAEVKTLVVGVIEEPVLEKGEWVVHTREVSYFSRLMEAEHFARAALVETHRRGVEKAEQVIAVTDGAEWEQSFIDYHRRDAARVLDFPHAGERIGRIGAALWGVETPATRSWVSDRLSKLKRQGASAVLPELRLLSAAHPEISEDLAYLDKREAHMQYPIYQAQGWPIGSGAVESSHTTVVESRLGGAGMHWARAHVNPMVSLRTAVCHDRWDEAWSHIARYRRQQVPHPRPARPTPPPPLPPADDPPPPHAITPLATHAAPVLATAPSSRPKLPRRPAPDHPWRTYPACTPSRRRWPTANAK
jgi:hypothetical protein